MMGAGEKVTQGTLQPRRSQAHSPRMEPPDNLGVPSPWRAHSRPHPAQGMPKKQALKWQGAGSGGEDKAAVLAPGRFLLPEPVKERLLTTTRRGKVTSTPGLVSTQQDTTHSFRPPPPGALLGECECTAGCLELGAGWVCTAPHNTTAA